MTGVQTCALPISGRSGNGMFYSVPGETGREDSTHGTFREAKDNRRYLYRDYGGGKE